MPSILLFIRMGQGQSTQTMENVKKALESASATQVVAVLSGNQPAEKVREFASQLPWPVVQDRGFTMVGQLRIRVWPTAVVVLPDGRELARLAGLPPSYVSDLTAYLDFAAKKIDRKTLQQRLATSGVVADTPYEIARRHLQVAQRLMEADQLEQALRELEQALKHQGDDPAILLAKARALLLLRRPAESMTILSVLDEASSLSANIGVLKGGALVAMKQWDEAIKVLQPAVLLNPDPSEGYYFLAVAHQHKGQWNEAAVLFRKAYESAHAGRLVARSLQAPGRPETRPTTRPTSRPTPGPRAD
jgi:tetratricopeptide (TPR) repeat protein